MIQIGQVWEEVDPRVERYVHVHGMHTGGKSVTSGPQVPTKDNRVTIVRCCKDGTPDPNGHFTFAKSERFNGKRGGYRLVLKP